MPTREPLSVIAHPTTGIRDMTKFQPGWTKFFQSIQDAGDAAAARGKRFGVDFSGFGNGMSQRTRGQSSPALRSLGAGPGQEPEPDPMNGQFDSGRLARDFALDQFAESRDDRASRAIAALENDPARMLGTGRAAAMARQSGDINRDEAVRDAEAGGRAAVAQYWAPGMREVRQQQLWDKEREQETLYPFSKVAGDAQRAIDVANINQQGRVGAAQVGANARRDSAALNALARAGTAPIFPGGEDRADTTMDAIRPNVPGQGPAPMGNRVFPAARLEQFAREMNFQSADQAREYLERIAGYRVQ